MMIIIQNCWNRSRERQLKDLAIAEPGVSTRAADAAATALKRGRCTRDFFVLKSTFAANDPIVLHLGDCLIPAIERHDGTNDQFVDRITTALNIHFARVYGGMHFSPPLVSGGLAPWQLRLARDRINAGLEEELSLKQIARECRLSASHFARAFTR